MDNIYFCNPVRKTQKMIIFSKVFQKVIFYEILLKIFFLL